MVFQVHLQVSDVVADGVSAFVHGQFVPGWIVRYALLVFVPKVLDVLVLDGEHHSLVPWDDGSEVVEVGVVFLFHPLYFGLSAHRFPPAFQVSHCEDVQEIHIVFFEGLHDWILHMAIHVGFLILEALLLGLYFFKLLVFVLFDKALPESLRIAHNFLVG